MGTGSVESPVLKWLGRLPTVPVPFFGPFVVPRFIGRRGGITRKAA